MFYDIRTLKEEYLIIKFQYVELFAMQGMTDDSRGKTEASIGGGNPISPVQEVLPFLD